MNDLFLVKRTYVPNLDFDHVNWYTRAKRWLLSHYDCSHLDIKTASDRMKIHAILEGFGISFEFQEYPGYDIICRSYQGDSNGRWYCIAVSYWNCITNDRFIDYFLYVESELLAIEMLLSI